MTRPRPTRSPWRITLAVWHALLLREAVARMFGKRSALLWLMVEPLAFIGFMVFVFTVLRARVVGGMDVTLWLVSGLLAFFLFRRTATQSASAVGANLALFTYRQVLPVDTVLVRAVLEGLIMLLISTLFLGGLVLWHGPLTVHDPLEAGVSLLGLWLLAVGWGLTVSVLSELVSELGNVLNLLMMPLMLVSGVVFPLAAIPYPWREWIMLNPVAHGIEGIRAGISPYYHHAPELNSGYLYGFTLVLVFLGLALQARYRNRLVAL